MDLLELPLPACMVSASLSLCGLRERRAGQRSPGPHLLYASGIQGEPLPCLPWGCLLTSKTGKLNTHGMVRWGCFPSLSPAQIGATPVPGEGSCLTGGSFQQKGRKTKGSESRLHSLAWKWTWLGSRFPYKSEANVRKLQPYPLTEDGKMPV